MSKLIKLTKKQQEQIKQKQKKRPNSAEQEKKLDNYRAELLARGKKHHSLKKRLDKQSTAEVLREKNHRPQPYYAGATNPLEELFKTKESRVELAIQHFKRD